MTDAPSKALAPSRPSSVLSGVVIVLVTLLGGWLVCASEVPLGVPGEWTWPRRPLFPEWWLGLIPLLGWGLAWVGCVTWGGSRVERCGRWEFAVWITALALITGEIHWSLQGVAPPEGQASKATWVLYYPGSSGYFTQAATDPRPLREYLRDYHLRMAQGDVLHEGTHPPGLVVGYRLLMGLVQSSPALQSLVLWSQPAEIRDGFEVIAENAARTAHPLTAQDRAVLWLAAWCMWFCAAAVVGPLFALLRHSTSPRASWYWVSLWAWIPALPLFWPKSDVSFAFWGCLLLDLWLGGLRDRSPLRCFLGGVVTWLGLFQSLALLPVGFLAMLLTIWRTWQQRTNGAVRWLPVAFGCGLLGGLLPIVALWLWSGCNLFQIWWYNYHNHAGFYAQYPRTYGQWLWVNPLELWCAIGPALGLGVLWAVPGMIVRDRQQAAVWPVFAACGVTWGLLWLTGKNMGEAARLWIFLMPWAIWLLGAATSSTEDAAVGPPPNWRVIAACQILFAIAVCTRVGGFGSL